MRGLPIFKAELRRSIWLLPLALFPEFFMCYGITRSRLVQLAYERFVYGFPAMYFYGITDIMFTVIMAGVLWTFLFVFLQFNKDDLDFKRALPYKNRELLLWKFAAWVTAAVPAVLFYAFTVTLVMNKYGFLMKALSWTAPDFSVTASGMVLNCLTVFLFLMGIYWYAVFCGSICKNALYGCVLAFYGIIVFICFMVFSGRMGILDPVFSNLDSLLKPFLTPEMHDHPEIFITLFTGAAINVVFMPLSLVFYGKGQSKHPLYRYLWTEKAVLVLSAIFGACLLPMAADLSEGAEVFIACTAGAVIGAVIEIVGNKFIKREISQ